MSADFPQVQWDALVEEQCRQLVRLAIREDLRDGCDWTTVALVSEPQRGAARLVARQAGVAAGLPAVEVILDEATADVSWQPVAADGHPIAPGAVLGRLAGSARDLLTLERIVLNFVGRLCGIATRTAAFVAAASGSAARIYDTRKTTPGWRYLEKYAVRCGGGSNHRLGLTHAILIKDNHLALSGSLGRSPEQAIRAVRAFLDSLPGARPEMPIEVEVDTLDQLRGVLAESPDIVLLDNMAPDQLAEAVAIRNQLAPQVVLEASGGVQLETVRAIARSGVDRISVGALTHSSPHLDVGLDWEPTSPAAP